MTNEAEFVTQLQAKGFGIVEAAEYACICASASVCMGIGIRACGCSPALLLLYLFIRTFSLPRSNGGGLWDVGEHSYTEEEKAYILGAAKIVVLQTGAGCVAASSSSAASSW